MFEVTLIFLNFERIILNIKCSSFTTGAPEHPKDLRAVNETTDSITLTWTPGFDGGADQNFRIRYKKSGTSIYYYREAPTNTTSYTITGLEPGANYDFFIAAYNFIGESAFTENVLKVSTKQIVVGMTDYVIPGCIHRMCLLTILSARSI